MGIEFYKINEVYVHKYYKVPKDLFDNPRYKTRLNSDAKLLYALLLDRMELSRENNWVNDRGEIFLIFTRDDLCEMLGLCKNTMTKAFKELSEAGLIYEKRQGRGLPNLIFIGKIEHGEVRNTIYQDNKKHDNPQYPQVVDKRNGTASLESQNLGIKKRKKCDSGSAKNGNQDSQILRPNKTDIMKTDRNETDNSQSVGKGRNETDGPTDVFPRDEIPELEEFRSILERCELHILNDRNIRLMFRHALETMFFSEYIKVGAARFPQCMVRSRMYNLHGSIIAYALDKMKTRTENTPEIRNSTNYIISTLWNCISEYHSDVELDPQLNRYLNTGKDEKETFEITGINDFANWEGDE